MADNWVGETSVAKSVGRARWERTGFDVPVDEFKNGGAGARKEQRSLFACVTGLQETRPQRLPSPDGRGSRSGTASVPAAV